MSVPYLRLLDPLRPPDLETVTVRCEDCQAVQVMTFDQAADLVEQHPDGSGTGLCECRP